MKKVLIIFSVIILLSSFRCMPEPQNKHLIYQNIVMFSDLSSRITNQRFPQKDNDKIHKVVQYFESECVKPGKKIGDKSSITFSTFSEEKPISIDLDKIKDLGDKQSFINSTNEYKNLGLANKLVDFENTVKSLYKTVANPGLDLISVLIEKIENENIVKHNKVITNSIDTTFIDYENHIYIFTDGYLEYASSKKQQNSQFYFGDSEIEKLRQYCEKNNVKVTNALDKEKSLGLPIYKSPENKNINLHILETHERDKDIKLQTYNHLKGFRDNEILEAVWRKWAKESSFKSFKWEKY